MINQFVNSYSSCIALFLFLYIRNLQKKGNLWCIHLYVLLDTASNLIKCVRWVLVAV